MENFVSTNVSKEKREQLVAKIKAIKSYIASAPQDENTAQLLAYIADIEKDIKGKKYGLVFEEHREKIDEILEQNTPVLTEEKDLFIDNGGQMNFLIEGDNLAALQLLEKTHKGKIDLIYIDPPYNTGNKDFVYDDAFVDINDTFRHSKWLSFMEKRLQIARNLLSEKGVIFISIDDNECGNLEMLCNSVFDEKNRIANLPRVIKRGGKSTDNIAKNHDTLLIYSKNSLSYEFNRVIISDDQSKNLTDEYFYERGSYRLNQCLDYDSLQYNESMDYEITIDGECFYAGGSKDLWTKRHNGEHKKIDWVWRWSKPLFEWGLENGFVVIKNGKRKRIYTKTYTNCSIGKDKNGNYCIIPTENSKPYDSLFFTDNSFSNDNGKKEYDRIELTTKFDYPKPTALIAECIKMTKLPTKAIILDFFAGSGTTGHAVMKLNVEDGGKRRFILCTNNENNICRDITFERIKRVIERDKYEASLKYYKVDFVPISDKLYYEYADELLKHIRELVELENGINFNGNAEIAIVLTEKELDEFAANMPEKCKAIYLGHDVLPSEAQESMFKSRGIAVNIIPDYYYRELEG